MPFVETALGIGALLGGAASAGSAVSAGGLNRKNRKWQEKMYNLQVTQRREDAQAQYERMKDYASWAYNKFESPIAQRSAMQAAGINPFFQGSALQPMGTPQGNVSQADGGSVPSQGPYSNNPMSNIMAGASSLREAALQGVQAENIQAQTELTNANRLKVQAESIGINKSNEILDIVKGIKDNELLSSGFRATMDKIASQYAEVNAIADVNEKAARIQELNERAAKEAAEAAKTDSDRLISQYMADANKRAVEAQANLANAQADTEGVKRTNLAADTDYKQALIDTENALREGRVRLTNQQANKVVEDIFGARIAQMREADDLARVLTGTDRTSSLWGLVDKLIEAASRGDNGPVSQETRDRYYRNILNRVKQQ
jgi:hypothetical protein